MKNPPVVDTWCCLENYMCFPCQIAESQEGTPTQQGLATIHPFWELWFRFQDSDLLTIWQIWLLKYSECHDLWSWLTIWSKLSASDYLRLIQLISWQILLDDVRWSLAEMWEPRSDSPTLSKSGLFESTTIKLHRVCHAYLIKTIHHGDV